MLFRSLPPFAPGCSDAGNVPAMEFIYPPPGIRIFIPRDQSGHQTRVIAEVIHRIPSKKIYWHLDNKFVGTTKLVHQFEFFAQSGDHILTVVDEAGNSAKSSFKVTGLME